MTRAAAARDIPDDIVCRSGDRPGSLDDGAAFLIDKPNGATSFHAVRAVRRWTGIKKVGHAGTLDPMATGLLIVLVSRPATRLQDAFMHLGKVYTATMRLGECTPSHDAETDVKERVDPSGVAQSDVEDAMQSFVGEIRQVPPMYSAVKMGGERLYKKARRGETVDRSPRIVSIYDLDVTGTEGADVHFRMKCSKGTYVRSLARDVGEALGVGAHLTALRRESIGEYHVDDAWTPAGLEAALTA